MANWLLDYIEMTEYIPPEFRDQSFSMRELDLKVSIAMSQLENDIKDFFSRIITLNAQEKQEQYEALLRKCEEASHVANTKIKIADRLHDLVEKSMRLLDQGLEKLKEDLIEGDKAYIVEDIERRSKELDEQLRHEEELKSQRHQRTRDSKLSQPRSVAHFDQTNSSNQTNSTRQPTLAMSAQNHQQNNGHYHHQIMNRSRNNSTGTQPGVVGRQKKRDRKRVNSAMTIFNRNSKTDEDQTFLSSPTTPDYLAGLHSSNSNSLNDLTGGDTGCLTLKGMISINKHSSNVGEKNNGYDPSIKARQPILTAIDAAHAISPSATNSDKLVFYANNSNGDKNGSATHLVDKRNNVNHLTIKNKNYHLDSNQPNRLNDHLLPPINHQDHNLFYNSASNDIDATAITRLNDGQTLNRSAGQFSTLTLSARHDPIMMAASQAINATQNMTPGRRTSSLKASYAAVNSGRLQHQSANHPVFDQSNLTGEIYCKCRGTVHDPNMIACDNANCKYEWFHYECVGITTPPPGEWYCDDCKGLSDVLDRTNTGRQSETGALTTT